MPAQVKHRSESHMFWHTAPRCKQQAWPLDGLRTSSLIGFFHTQNNSAAHGGEVRSHLEAAIHSLPVLHAKAEVLKLMPSSGCCCATWRGQKGPLSPSLTLPFPPAPLFPMQMGWGDIATAHPGAHTSAASIGEEGTAKSWAFLALPMLTRSSGHHAFLSSPSL